MGKGTKGKSLRVGRVTRNRKDGEDIKFKKWNGEKGVGKYAPFATIFARPGRDGGFMLSLAIDDGDEEMYYNIFLNDGVKLEVDEDELEGSQGGGRRKSREGDDEDEEDRPRKKSKKPARDEDEDDSDDEEGAPF